MDREPIAIVGIGCRFPGGIACPKDFWRLLQNGVDAITEIPPDRIDVNAYYDPRPSSPGKMMTRWGGFLDQIDRFDASFFGISPREADRMDPQQRLLLEVAWEAMEDAGQPIDSLAGNAAGVFIGLWLNDYEARLFANPTAVDFYMTTGTGRYSASGRLSYFLGLQGPSITIDTACSSSLVAVHLACQSLWRNECSMALAGGANVILQPHISIAYSQSKMMAPDGRCKFGDAGANGYVRSEGAGIVVLKPLAAALKDGDQVYALIRGSAVNNDGRSSGYMTTPARDGQEKMLRRAYRDAGLSPGLVRYVEAHGTGTLAGDPVEISSLGSVLSSDRAPGLACYVGSVKTNFGHTEGAAGIAGLIKTALVVQHGLIPPSLHLKELNPAIPWKDYSLVIPRELTSWPQDPGPAVAGVSAFGIAGTNAHVVLSAAPRTHSGARACPAAPFVLPLSAHSPEALACLARAYIPVLEDEAAPSLYDICYTASVRRTHHEHRLALVATSRPELSECLKAFLRGDRLPQLCAGKAELERPRRVVFVCPGQGSQWLGMGRQLIRREVVFRETIEQCEQAMKPYVDWSLEEQFHLVPDSPRYRLNEIDVIQPALVSMEVALAALWRSWGVGPDAVVGHSLGEVAAGFVAGALTLDDAMRIICCRSSLMRRVSGKGAMAVVALSLEEAQKALDGWEEHVAVAVSNSPRSTVLSGHPEAVGKILDKLQARDVFCRLVNVDVASHSPQMDLLTDDLLRALDGIRPRKETAPIYSTVTGERSEGINLDASYWARNLRSPVLFCKTVQRLAEDDHSIFIELSPHPILTASIEETIGNVGREAHAISSLEREKDELTTLLSSVGRLYTIGYPVDWARFFPVAGKIVSLPAYPWQRQRFWMETLPVRRDNAAALLRTGLSGTQDHPLLGVRFPDVASLPGNALWQNQLDVAFRDYLREHQIESSSLLSEPVCVAMAWAAANAVFGEKLHRISGIAIDQSPLLRDGAQTQFVLAIDGPGSGSFQIFGREPRSTGGWKRHASGKIDAGHAEANWLYEIAWKPKPLPYQAAEVRNGSPGMWLIFADRDGFGSSVADLMTARGEECVLVFPGDSFEVEGARRFRASPTKPSDIARVLDQAFGVERLCRGAIYLWSLDSAARLDTTAPSLQNSQSLGCDGALHLIQALARMEWKISPRLWLVTRGAQAAEPEDGTSLSVEQAPLWGLGRVIALEHPLLWGGLVDLPHSGNPTSTNVQAAEALCEEVLVADGEDQVAVRPGRRYVARLVRSHPGHAKESFRLLPDASYLITGGLGSLGLRLAHWLITRGARNLILTSRTGLPDRSTWASVPPETEIGRRVAAIQALEKSGATVHVTRTDVADPLEMSKLWDALESDHPPLRGIIHAAGILGLRNLVDLSVDELHEVARSKMMGAWLLHELTQRERTGAALDFFVLFSSAASVWGSQRLAHYAAANHFLDALAHRRAALGLPALSANWGWWEGAGMVSEDLAALFRSIGLKDLPTGPALAALAYLLETGAAQKVVADVEWDVFRPIFEARRKRPLLEHLTDRTQAPSETAKAHDGKTPGLLEQIRRASPIERKPLLHNYIRAQVAEILGFSSSDPIDPRQGFFKMGMDSIMTVQLRNRLEGSLGCSLPPTVAFEYPTVDTLTQFLAEAIVKSDDSRRASAVIQPPPQERTPEAGQENLSEDDLVELLAKKLDQIR